MRKTRDGYELCILSHLLMSYAQVVNEIGMNFVGSCPAKKSCEKFNHKWRQTVNELLIASTYD